VTSVAIAPEDAADDIGVRITHKLKPLKVCVPVYARYDMYVHVYVCMYIQHTCACTHTRTKAQAVESMRAFVYTV
jgi:hypothetical protein